MDDELMSTTAVSQRTTLPVGTLRFLRHDGRGPKSFKLGRRVVYRRADVEAWIEAQRASAVGDDLPAA